MTILNIGILAIVAAFNSGALALQRSGRISTASTLADQQLELYRAVKYTDILLSSTSETSARTDTNYNCDKTMGTTCGSKTQVTGTCTSLTGETGSPPPRCNASRTVAACVTAGTAGCAPDHHRYRVDTYIILDYATNSTTSRQAKVVTVVVRDGNKLSSVLARQSSIFDQSTGS